jgi:hypothetical protein
MTVLGRTLWNRDLDFAALVEDYFRSAFGEGAEAARRYCETISELFNPRLLRGEADEAERAAAPEKLARVPEAAAEIAPAVEKGLASPNPCHAASWGYLQAHTELVQLLAAALAAKYHDQPEEAKALGRKMFDWARQNELRLQSVFDVFEFQLTIGPILGLSGADLA